MLDRLNILYWTFQWEYRGIYDGRLVIDLSLAFAWLFLQSFNDLKRCKKKTKRDKDNIATSARVSFSPAVFRNLYAVHLPQVPN